MCSIVGLINVSGSKQKLIDSLKMLKNRGKDNYGCFFNNKGVNYSTPDDFSKENIEDGVVLGHTLHSIVSNVKQPIIFNKSVLVSNCEVYNYKEISKKYNLDVKNDSELIIKAIYKKGIKVIEEFSGPFAFAYLSENKLFLARDILGIRPLWFGYTEKSFSFASEKKVLEKIGFEKINFLDPRKILVYDLVKKKISFRKRDFYKVLKGKTNVQEIKTKITESILKRIPDKSKKIGLLYSGGIDSLIIAKILKDNKIPFKGYFSYSENVLNPRDLKQVLRTEKNYKLNIEKIKVSKKDVEKNIPKIIELIESSNPVKVGVSLPIYFASKKAREDGCKVIFSGLGSDEIFAGYHRFKESTNLLNDTINLLYQMHENDLYRDDVICMNNNIELRVPYLDKDLIEESFKLKDVQKINEGENKIILREVGEKLDLLKEDFQRKKVAAQYGSGFDKMIERLSKENGYKSKSDFLKSFTHKKNLKVGSLFSGGKDSNLALDIMQKQNYDVCCLLTMISEDPDSYMFQQVDKRILSLQSQALSIPFIFQKTKGVKEEELKDLKKLIKNAKEKYNLDGLVTGAIKSNYQRERIQKICNDLGIRMFSPLWNKSQESILQEILDRRFKMIFVKVAGYGLSESWLGKTFTEKEFLSLKKINEKYKINIAGEGGEYETIVLDGPTFKKRINVLSSRKIMENEFTGFLKILKLNIGEK